MILIKSPYYKEWSSYVKGNIKLKFIQKITKQQLNPCFFAIWIKSSSRLKLACRCLPFTSLETWCIDTYYWRSSRNTGARYKALIPSSVVKYWWLFLACVELFGWVDNPVWYYIFHWDCLQFWRELHPVEWSMVISFNAME